MKLVHGSVETLAIALSTLMTHVKRSEMLIYCQWPLSNCHYRSSSTQCHCETLASAVKLARGSVETVAIAPSTLMAHVKNSVVLTYRSLPLFNNHHHGFRPHCQCATLTSALKLADGGVETVVTALTVVSTLGSAVKLFVIHRNESRAQL